MHLAVQLLDGARRAKFGPALSRYGIVHPCDSGSALDSAVAGGAAVVVMELGNPDDAETLDVLVGLRQEHPGLCLIVLYEPAGEELREAVKLAQRRLGLWFACGTDAELDLLFARVEAGRLPAAPTPAEVAVACVAELSPGPAARRFAWFCGLTPTGHLGEAAAAARCGEKLRTVQRQFADIGVTTGAVRRAFRTVHAAYWLRGCPRDTGGIALIFGWRSARALREGVKHVLGVGVQELRRWSGADTLGLELVSRLRAVPARMHPRPRQSGEPRDGTPQYRVAPHVTVTLTRDTIAVNLKSGATWTAADMTGVVLVEVVQGRSRSQIVPRLQRDYGLTRGGARAVVDGAMTELAARGVVEFDDA